MSKLKDKLSANMRSVKANQPQTPAKAAPAKTASAPPVPGRTAPPPPPSVKAAPPSRPVPQSAKKSPPANPAPTPAKSVPGDVQDTGNALFPARVWPD